MIVRALFYGLLLWLLYRLVKGLGPRRPERRRTAPGTAVRGGDLVQDPQCGVYIPVEDAVKGPGGTRFCSEACRDAYRSRKS